MGSWLAYGMSAAASCAKKAQDKTSNFIIPILPLYPIPIHFADAFCRASNVHFFLVNYWELALWPWCCLHHVLQKHSSMRYANQKIPSDFITVKKKLCNHDPSYFSEEMSASPTLLDMPEETHWWQHQQIRVKLGANISLMLWGGETGLLP